MSPTFVIANSAMLKVPGAKIYYEVQGKGPVLLMIPGGPADAGAFADLAPLMADKYKTVCYDPRGNSRSIIDGPPQDQDMDQHGDDAAALIAALGDQPSFVLGSSGGAQIGLNLAARYPDRVRVLVAHEPPCLQLLPDAEVRLRNAEEVLEVFRTSGVGPAMQKFAAMAGLGGDRKKRPGPPPISLYTPDISALEASKTWVVVGVGAESEGQLARRSAMALAMRMGLKPVTFPGGHVGYGEEPGAFAQRLEEVLAKAN